ncbi:GAF domain-containing sensor histidine kinase [Rubrolithibacter danxiaensis]|uniref:GAF domain-containing sensor histidine kinase n=1 Tax=Rubrolithibacter danxiaensis TaxID=3390805 RepID=UPI003BF85757
MENANEILSKKESERIEALRHYNILDTPPDGSFDRITRLASKLLDVPIAIVSLVDTDRIWFKSRYGIDASQIDRDPGLCASAILSGEVYLVEDAAKDPRTLANPLVAGEFGLRFYAAAPLKTKDGYNLGTLCIIDKNPRHLTEFQKEILQDLADTVMDQMELRLAIRTTITRQNQILYITAHDLKNPLTTIPVRADLIKRKKGDPDSIDLLCDQIKEAGIKMSRTINELLEAASLEAGKVKLRSEKLDLADLARQVVIANQSLAENKYQKLNLTIEDELWVIGDKSKMAEILDNLINNAIKYSPNGKDILVKVSSRDRKAIIEVKDEGPGLTAKDKQQLFQRFTTLSARPTGGETATGLGLSIVKTLVEAHQGTIKAESSGQGQGSVFMVELPLLE